MGKRYTIKETDIWGNEKEVHYEDGKKIGETRFKDTLFSGRIQEHFDADGEKIGETRRGGFFNDKAIHYDADGNKVGYSENVDTIFSGVQQRHYDKSGKLVGKSHVDAPIFGSKRKVHEGKFFKARDRVEKNSVDYDSDDFVSSITFADGLPSKSISGKRKSGLLIWGIGIVLGLLGFLGVVVHFGSRAVFENLGLAFLWVVIIGIVIVLAIVALPFIVIFGVGTLLMKLGVPVSTILGVLLLGYLFVAIMKDE